MKIFDSSPLIAILGELNQPIILEQTISLGYSLYAPFAVVNEISKNPSRENLSRMIGKKQITKLKQIDGGEMQSFRNRYYKLGLGESEVILTANKWQAMNKKFCCIIDDQVARKVCEDFNFKCKGTIGILKKLNEQGLLTSQEMEMLFKKLEEAGFRYKFK